ncbi:ribosome biogenesis protein SLX9 homolog isoform X2 [Ambystoma mexicanum]|uniref:ribosome biogenesis protein SLX9 homolog isoform X2 n=1 Tax=Ambystoma mexicanum TaxID=8296 RepID=UPI0037E9951E
MGKIKHVRQKLHAAAVRFAGEKPAEELPSTKDEEDLSAAAMLRGSAGWTAPPGGKDWTFLSSDIFGSTQIDPKALVQTLEPVPKPVVAPKKGAEEKPLLSKKEKVKLRRDRWLQKIDALKLAQQMQKEQAKRKATPVVGDMRSLVDALPELSELITIRKPRMPRKQPKTLKKIVEPTNYSQMKPAQKRRLVEEEVARFHEVIANPSYKANPLALIGEHLAKKMKQEEEQNPT